VFAGGFTFEAAETIGAGEYIAEYEVLDLLASLVDKSLVLVESVMPFVRRSGWSAPSTGTGNPGSSRDGAPSWTLSS
jgi:hypothetical protein